MTDKPTREDVLRQVAKAAIDDYSKETADGGEPPFPQWAYDLLEMIDEQEALQQAILDLDARVLAKKIA
jgi:hypothetical protein